MSSDVMRSARHNTTARGVAASRRRASRKKGQNSHFFPHTVTGNGGRWQASEAPKYFGGGAENTKFSLPPSLTHQTMNICRRGVWRVMVRIVLRMKDFFVRRDL